MLNIREFFLGIYLGNKNLKKKSQLINGIILQELIFTLFLGNSIQYEHIRTGFVCEMLSCLLVCHSKPFHWVREEDINHLIISTCQKGIQSQYWNTKAKYSNYDNNVT